MVMSFFCFPGPMLRIHQLIPPLTAHTPSGHTVQAWDYKQKRNLVIAFLHPGCGRCREFLSFLAKHAAALEETEAVAMVIFSEPAPLALQADLPSQIRVATDVGGRTQCAFLGEDAFGPSGQVRVGVFVADRYGELYAQWVGTDETALPARCSAGWDRSKWPASAGPTY